MSQQKTHTFRATVQGAMPLQAMAVHDVLSTWLVERAGIGALTLSGSAGVASGIRRG